MAELCAYALEVVNDWSAVVPLIELAFASITVSIVYPEEIAAAMLLMS